MRSGMIKIGILAALGIAGVATTGQLMAGTPQVVSTIQTGSGVGAASKGRAIDGAGGTLPGKALTV